jgi:cytochrome c biogenesis protein ResB
MMSLSRRVWLALGSIHLTVGLCLALAIDLGLGYLSLQTGLTLFVPMSDTGIFPWLFTYGLHNLDVTGWFFALIGLLGVLFVNTFACTTERLIQTFAANRRRPGWAIKLSPHVMHYAVLVILAGYLCSYVFSESFPGRALRPGEGMALPDGSGSVVFVGFAPEYYDGERLDEFKNFVMEPNARLILSAGGTPREETLAFNRPVHFNSFGLYLNDFSPRKKKEGMSPPNIRLTIRRDPSSAVYLTGVLLFVIGLGMYVFERAIKR